MEYRAAFIDIDGTLLDSKGNVSHAARESILRLKRKGMHVVINTGRILKEAVNILRFAGIKTPIIAANGAYVMDCSMQKVIFKDTLDEYVLKWMLEKSKIYDVSIGFSGLQKFYCDESFFELSRNLNFTWQMKEKQGMIDEPVGVQTDEEWNAIFSRNEIMRCNFFGYEFEPLQKIREDVLELDRLAVASVNRHSIEFNNKAVSKGNAMLKYLEYHGIEIEKSFAIGDGDNDISMIEMAGFGVAMGNAEDELKEKADYITETNDRDGLAMAIDKFLC
jgi:Cof subfamily protein (haloacid dehalogenase superfamily)